jgi:hypothetical protein
MVLVGGGQVRCGSKQQQHDPTGHLGQSSLAEVLSVVYIFGRVGRRRCFCERVLCDIGSRGVGLDWIGYVMNVSTQPAATRVPGTGQPYVLQEFFSLRRVGKLSDHGALVIHDQGEVEPVLNSRLPLDPGLSTNRACT